jgi:hypothetical protein
MKSTNSELPGSSGQAGGRTALAVRGLREAIEEPRRGQPPPAAGNHLRRPATRAAIHEREETTFACVLHCCGLSG